MKLLAPREVAAELGCTAATAGERMRKMTHYVLGRRMIRVNPVALLEWASDHGQPNTVARIAPRIVEALPRGNDCWVYFVSPVEGGPIKIGIADVLRDRLRRLQTGNPERLEIVGAMRGSRITESALHETFERHRMVGEWFRDAPAIRAVAKCVGLPNGFSVREERGT